jgi:3-methyladenine DNA glycosylase AlkD
MSKINSILSELEALGNKEYKEGMNRFAIENSTAYGVKLPVLRNFAKSLGKDPHLSEELWETGIHEAQLLAVFVNKPAFVTEELMEKWVKDFNSWDICDQAIGGLFCKTPFGFTKAVEWSKREKEFEKRAGYSMMAMLAVHNKKADDQSFLDLFPFIAAGADDERNFVKKAVNWAIRQIGKRNAFLHNECILLSEALLDTENKAAVWIAKDALRELRSEKVLNKLGLISN